MNSCRSFQALQIWEEFEVHPFWSRKVRYSGLQLFRDTYERLRRREACDGVFSNERRRISDFELSRRRYSMGCTVFSGDSMKSQAVVAEDEIAAGCSRVVAMMSKARIAEDETTARRMETHCYSSAWIGLRQALAGFATCCYTVES